MSAKKKKNIIAGAISVLIGLFCALVLAAVFYGAMAYQLADGALQSAEPVSRQESDLLLALSGAELIAQQTLEQEYDGVSCTVTVRTFKTDSGLELEAISASPAVYIARLSEEGWTAQLITGFTLAGLDAVYSVRAQEGMLSARQGERIYMLRAQADEQTLYALGAGAYLE